uniref:Gustatory receptor n=1 Tax=Histia rhodope TaxID=1453155 RepID=A0A7G4KBY7_9NEOP|nr:gustatory receptor [Histia rhodope]
MSLICCFPKIMYILYGILKLYKARASALPIVVLGFGALQWGLMPCLPGAVMEFAYNEVEKIKKTLVHQCQYNKDELLREDIKEFIQYIDSRPYKYRILRMITVDMSLPIGLLKLCTTYFIVIIQFTHLFE